MTGVGPSSAPDTAQARDGLEQCVALLPQVADRTQRKFPFHPAQIRGDRDDRAMRIAEEAGEQAGAGSPTVTVG
jgi:hypothetical protein